VILNKSDLDANIQVDEEQIDQAYGEYLAQLGEYEERKASHILIEITDERNDDAASALAQQISAKAKAGEDFAQLAKQYSDDIGSKNLGGDLGFNTRGGFVTEFDGALFAMTEGQVSETVKTEFGYHVIKLDAIRKPEVVSKDAKSAEIIAEIKSSQLSELFAEQSEALAAAAFENDNIENLVASGELDLKAENSGLFTRSQGAGIALHALIRNAAFAEKVMVDRELSDVIEISADQVAVIGLSKHVEPAIKPLADIKAIIEGQLMTEKANDLAIEKANALVANIESGDASVTWSQIEAATFSDAGEAPVELNKAVFALAKIAGEVVSTKVANGQAVARLKAVTQVEVEAAAEDTARISQAKANESFYVYRQWAKSNSDIELGGS
jgi:peptidyl-prolyl cis-trans isomerase D